MIVDGEPGRGLVERGALTNIMAWAAMESWERKAPREIDYACLDAALGARPSGC